MIVSLNTYVFTVATALVILVVVIEMLRRRRLRERHALWWFIAGSLALVVSVFPSTLVWASDLLGVEVPLNLVLFVGLAVLFLVSVQQNAELTALESKARVLAESSALLELRMERLESQHSGGAPRSAREGDEMHDDAEHRRHNHGNNDPVE
jgi:hypothetical protein